MPAPIDTARATGLAYLAMAVAGAVGHVALAPGVFDASDPAGSLANLAANEPVARVVLVLELVIVVTQALTALGFYRLFRPVDSFLAGSLAAFGLVNAVAILGSSAALATALEVALDPGPGAEGTVQAAILTSGNFWDAGTLFFGLWLIPMGLLVLRAGGGPRAFGLVLVVGGALYVASGFLLALVPSAGSLADVLALPATVGEVWMIGWLLVRGERRLAGAPVVAVTA